MEVLIGDSSIDEIVSENRHLKNELIFTNKYLNILSEYKCFIDSVIIKFKDYLDPNECQKYENLCKEANETNETLFRQKFYSNQMSDNEPIVKTYVCARYDCRNRFWNSDDFVQHIKYGHNTQAPDDEDDDEGDSGGQQWMDSWVEESSEQSSGRGRSGTGVECHGHIYFFT